MPVYLNCAKKRENLCIVTCTWIFSTSGLNVQEKNGGPIPFPWLKSCRESCLPSL